MHICVELEQCTIPERMSLKSRFILVNQKLLAAEITETIWLSYWILSIYFPRDQLKINQYFQLVVYKIMCKNWIVSKLLFEPKT